MNKNTLIWLIVVGLFFLWMWEKNRAVREMDLCEGMTQQECEAYSEVMGNR